MTDTLTHALTIHQPYAWAVAAGHKPVENRTWRPPLEAVGKLIGIHAGLANIRKSTEAVAYWPKEAPFPFVPGGPTLTYGALIGVARLVGIVARKGPWDSRAERSLAFVHGKGSIYTSLPTRLAERIRPWWRGPWGWLLEEAVLLPEPIPMRGQQGLWRIPAEMFLMVSGRPAQQFDPRTWALEQWRKARETR